MPSLSWRKHIATLALGVVIILMYVLEGGFSGAPGLMRIVGLGAQVNVLVLTGQWWRIIAATFISLNLTQFLGTLIVLLITGWIVEPIFGTWRFLGVYILGGLMGGLAALVAYPPYTVLAGAAGAILAVQTALLIAMFSKEVSLTRYPARWPGIVMILYVVWVLASGVRSGWWDDIGGLVGGALMFLAFRGRQQQRSVRTTMAATIYVVACVVMAGLAVVHG